MLSRYRYTTSDPLIKSPKSMFTSLLIIYQTRRICQEYTKPRIFPECIDQTYYVMFYMFIVIVYNMLVD